MKRIEKITIKAKKPRVVVGLSGGVDSSVTAALLVEQGYEVIGVFMKNWSQDVGDFVCAWSEDLADARRVAQILDLRFYVWNFEEEYRQGVIDYFFREYKAGRTPNPDIMCNQEIKFKVFLSKAKEFGADYVATGHYARVVKKNEDYSLLKGRDNSKDQTYFLYTLKQEQLAKTIFPLGNLQKSSVRKLAKKFNLPTYNKPDSQGICFIGEVDIRALLKQRLKPKKGKIVYIDGSVLGEHEGAVFYTLGQRGGLELSGGPYYVVAKDMKKNLVIVSDNPQDPLLWRRECIVKDLSLTKERELPKKITAVIRYRHPAQEATVKRIDNKTIKLTFKEAQRAITPGQAAVFYDQDEVLGGGVIDRVL